MSSDNVQHGQTLTITVTLDEHDRGSRAAARLQWRDCSLTGFGLSRIEVDNLGKQQALARALSDLSRQLSAPSG